MGEPTCDGDLAAEPLAPERTRDLRAEHLEGNVSFLAEIAGEIDRGHAAPAELAHEPEAINEDGLEVG